MTIREQLDACKNDEAASRKIFEANPALKHLLASIEFLQEHEVAGRQALALGEAIAFLDALLKQVLDDEVKDGQEVSAANA